MSKKGFFKVGRVILSVYFLVPGILKFIMWNSHIELMELHKIPFPQPLLLIAGISNIIIATMLLNNRFLRSTAVASILYIIVINISLHDFWNFSGIIFQHELQNFVKNTAIIGGLFILASYQKKHL
jgi:putative oxidoreductase